MSAPGQGCPKIFTVIQNSATDFDTVDITLNSGVRGRLIYLKGVSFLRSAGSNADRFFNLIFDGLNFVDTHSTHYRSDNVATVSVLTAGSDLDRCETFSPPLYLGPISAPHHGGNFKVKFEFPQHGSAALRNVALQFEIHD